MQDMTPRRKANPAPRIGAALRKARLADGASVTDRAKALRINRDGVYRLEEGLWKLHSMRYVQVLRICSAYGNEATRPLCEALDELAATT